MNELGNAHRREDTAAETATAVELPVQATDGADNGPRSTSQTNGGTRREIIDGAPAIGPAQRSTDLHTGTADNGADQATSRVPQSPDATGLDGDSGDGGQDTADTVEVPRFDRKDLQPTDRTDPTYGEPIFIGPDGKDHFDGDPIDTRRNVKGRLQHQPDAKYATDSNPRPTDKLQERAHHDLPSRHDHKPEPGASSADDGVVKAVDDRRECEQRRDTAWEKLEAVADKLKTHGVIVDKSSTRLDNQELVVNAQPYLTAAERLQLPGRLKELAQLNQAIKDSSERLGTAGGTLAVQRDFPTAVTITGGTMEKGTPGNFDRVVMIDERKQAIIILEEKGVGSGLGSRLAPDTTKSGGPHIRAEQGSTSYLRHLLQTDTKLAAALDKNPALRERMQAIVNGGGQVRYILARTSSKGIVTMTDFKIDAARLSRQTIKLPSRQTGV